MSTTSEVRRKTFDELIEEANEGWLRDNARPLLPLPPPPPTPTTAARTSS